MLLDLGSAAVQHYSDRVVGLLFRNFLFDLKINGRFHKVLRNKQADLIPWLFIFL
jgi:hypothetical protein